MAFSPPTRTEMTEVILRALRDPTASVFPVTTIADFINEALSDLSVYRPIENTEVCAFVAGGPISVETFTSVWRVELVVTLTNGRKRATILPRADNSVGRAGWDFYGGQTYISYPFLTQAEALDNLYGGTAEWHIFGYADRAYPAGDDSVLDLRDATDYACLLAHCKALGFELLTHDRSLYQQWLAATNNTDVSPTQLSGMSNMADAAFQRQRARNTKVRRVANVELLYTY
jgi:hypothetical protein